MNTVVSLVRRVPRRLSAVAAMIAAAIIVPAALLAYGPVDRPTYTYEHPADHVTFNSITDNPNVGDERNFVRIKEDSTSTTYGKSVTLQPGKTYQVMVYYHNNAASNLNTVKDASGNYIGIAKDVMLRMQMPGIVSGNANATISGFISSSNATPATVWDSATAVNGSASTVALRYVPGSATVTSNGAVNGKTLPDSLFTNGTPLGYDSLNGVLPGCNQYAGYVVFKFTVDQPNFTVQKQVSADGGKTWGAQATATPGSTVQYRVIYDNTGTTQQDHVTVTDMLPKGMTYVPGSTFVANSKTGGLYKATVDGVTSVGFDIGSYAAGSNAYLKFSAKVPANDQLTSCGTNTLTNVARVSTSGGYKESSATLSVAKTCVTPSAVYTCTALTASKISGSETKYAFTAKATAANGATIEKYVIDFGDNATITTTNPVNVTHTYVQNGKTYTAKVAVQVKVNGYTKTVTSDACTATITVGQAPQCKPGIPMGDTRCNETPVTTTTSTPTPPTAPTPTSTLPKTGSSMGIMSIAGLGSLVSSVSYFIASRRGLLSAIRRS